MGYMFCFHSFLLNVIHFWKKSVHTALIQSEFRLKIELLLLQVGQGTYSNVYKACDKDTGKLVALKKVRFDTSESESVKFMAREIMILQKLDHPNVLKLEGLATSRMQYSLYLVFEFMQTDLARVISRPDGRLTEPQVLIIF